MALARPSSSSNVRAPTITTRRPCNVLDRVSLRAQHCPEYSSRIAPEIISSPEICRPRRGRLKLVNRELDSVGTYSNVPGPSWEGRTLSPASSHPSLDATAGVRAMRRGGNPAGPGPRWFVRRFPCVLAHHRQRQLNSQQVSVPYVPRLPAARHVASLPSGCSGP